MTAFLVSLTVLLYGLGHVLLKLGLTKLGPADAEHLSSPSYYLQALSTPPIPVALLLCLIGTISYLGALSRAPLASVFPFLSLLFPLVAFLSWLVLGEPLTWRISAGLVLLLMALFIMNGSRI